MPTNNNYTISHFRSQIEDIARPYQWRCIFTNGAGVAEGKEVIASMRTANMPGISINPVAVSYFGMIYNLAGTPSYEPFNASIIIDSEYKNLKEWRKVMDKVFEYDETKGPSWKVPEAYMGFIQMQLLNNQFEMVNNYTLHHAWLSNIGAIQYGHETKDTPLEFTATVTYSFFINQDG